MAPLENYLTAQEHAPGKAQSPAQETSAQLGAEEHVGVVGPWAQDRVPSREMAPHSRRRLGSRQTVSGMALQSLVPHPTFAGLARNPPEFSQGEGAFPPSI